MQWQERTQKLWRQAPAFEMLPEAFRKHGIEVDERPFKKLAQFVASREEYLWGRLKDYVEGRRTGCRLKTSVASGYEIYHFMCRGNDGREGAVYLRDAVKAIYEALPPQQRQWFEKHGESLLAGFELADAGLKDGYAYIGTVDGFNVVLYSLAKYAAGKKIEALYIRELSLTRRGARPHYRLTAEATLTVSKKVLTDMAKRGLPIPDEILRIFRNPAAWLGLILGDGAIAPRALAVSTDTPELIRQLVPYTAGGYSSRKVTLKRFVADIVVRHVESVLQILDVLAQVYRDAAPAEPKWTRLKQLAARPIDAKTALELYRYGLYELLGEIRIQKPDFVAFRREENSAVVYTYIAEIDGQQHATQARYKYRRGKGWIATIFTKDLQLLQKIKTELGINNNIRQKKDGRYTMELYKKAMI